MKLGFLGLAKAVLLSISMVLTACGGGGSGAGGGNTGGGAGGGSGGAADLPAPVPFTYTVGGTLSGLSPTAGQSFTLLLNGNNSMVASANGSFVFPMGLATGASYTVTIGTQPTGQKCFIKNGRGSIGGAGVTNVAVNCLNLGETILHAFTGGALDGSSPFCDLVMDSVGNLYGTTPTGGGTGLGTVFKVTPTGISSILHSFSGAFSDGSGPYAGLVIDRSGNLYGVTSGGGSSNAGTVFKITPTGTHSLVHTFTGGTTDGAAPFGMLLIDPSGNLYGTTSSGGAFGHGTVFKVAPDGTESLLYSFTGGTTAGPSYNLVMDSSGNLYGMTIGGGVGGMGSVFKITPAGTESLVYSFAGGTTDGAFPRSGLTIDSNGNLYGTTSIGGAGSAGTVFKITSAGTESLLHSFAGFPTDGDTPYGRLMLDGAGNIYGTTSGGGASNWGAVFKIASTGTESIMYSFANSLTDGVGPFAGLVMDSDDNLYGTTNGGFGLNGSVFRIVP